MPFRLMILSSSVVLSALLGGCQTAKSAARVYHQEILSESYVIDRKYKSMKGPSSGVQVTLLDSMGEDERELLWIRGYKAVMVGADGESNMSQEFMCHSNLDFNAQKHRFLFEQNKFFNPRLFTLSQGQFEIEFPPGFGIPIYSDEEMHLTTQVLNLNLDNADLEVRHKVRIDFMRDKDLSAPLKPLFTSSAYGLVLLDGENPYFGLEKEETDEHAHGTGCLVGFNADNHTYGDRLGQKFTGHWVVPPGRQVNRTLVTQLMNLPFDTTIHYIAVHLHPFAESLELYDLTADQTVFKSHAENRKEGIGLNHVDAFSSIEGVPVFKDHEYELISVYNNTTEEDQDSMAVMYLYLLDRDIDFSS